MFRLSQFLAKAFFWVAAFFSFLTSHALADELNREDVAALIEPPYKLGELVSSKTWELINLDGRVAGYAFETEPLAPLPGFSGAPINLLVSVALDGKFIDVELVNHNEPIFVSGLGNAKFHNFVEQYRGLSIKDSLVVGVPYGDKGGGSSLIYLKGVTKATASVRIAHESILGAAFAIAREKLGVTGVAQKVKPAFEYQEELNWDKLVSTGIATRRLVTNAEADSAFKDTLWENDDPIAKEKPEEAYLDLWVVDVGSPAIAKAVLSDASYLELQEFLTISDNDEPLLIIDDGRHGLVKEDFVRNTSPDLVFAKQDGLPIALRDSDLEVELKNGVPGNVAMILRTDRRLGFDPTREFELFIRATREHGSFRPEIGTVDFTTKHKTDERFYEVVKAPIPEPPWKQAIKQRSADLAGVSVLTGGIFFLLLTRMNWLSGLASYTPIRLSILAVVIGFVGWWGQGQLSIATVLGFIRSTAEGQSLSFLLYDPFSLLLWAVVLISFVIWGRGFFCGWLCPFGAMQEFAHHIGRFFKVPQIAVPDWLDRYLINLKYVVLVVMLAMIFISPATNDVLIEIEPFKTAVTTFFIREWYYVAYAVGLILISMTLFKGFCRYICPLGAFMAIGGLLRRKDWIDRRPECGSPCQLCKVKCNYGAIEKSGAIKYSECFQCLDCVTIHDDKTQCVPLVLAAKGRAL